MHHHSATQQHKKASMPVDKIVLLAWHLDLAHWISQSVSGWSSSVGWTWSFHLPVQSTRHSEWRDGRMLLTISTRIRHQTSESKRRWIRPYYSSSCHHTLRSLLHSWCSVQTPVRLVSSIIFLDFGPVSRGFCISMHRPYAPSRLPDRPSLSLLWNISHKFSVLLSGDLEMSRCLVRSLTSSFSAPPSPGHPPLSCLISSDNHGSTLTAPMTATPPDASTGHGLCSFHNGPTFVAAASVGACSCGTVEPWWLIGCLSVCVVETRPTPWLTSLSSRPLQVPSQKLRRPLSLPPPRLTLRYPLFT